MTDCHDGVIKWKHFPRYWPFVRGIHRSPVNSPHKGQWLSIIIQLGILPENVATDALNVCILFVKYAEVQWIFIVITNSLHTPRLSGLNQTERLHRDRERYNDFQCFKNTGLLEWLVLHSSQYNRNNWHTVILMYNFYMTVFLLYI